MDGESCSYHWRKQVEPTVFTSCVFHSTPCSGIGFALAQRLLSEGVGDGESVRVCLACRNTEKAEAARQSLMADNPGCQVDIVRVDVSSIASVKAACAEIERRCVCCVCVCGSHGVCLGQV